MKAQPTFSSLQAELITLGTKVPAAVTVALPPNTPPGALGVTLERSKQLCLQMYEKELFTETSYENVMSQLVCTPEQLAVFAGQFLPACLNLIFTRLCSTLSLGCNVTLKVSVLCIWSAVPAGHVICCSGLKYICNCIQKERHAASNIETANRHSLLSMPGRSKVWNPGIFCASNNLCTSNCVNLFAMSV